MLRADAVKAGVTFICCSFFGCNAGTIKRAEEEFKSTLAILSHQSAINNSFSVEAGSKHIY